MIGYVVFLIVIFVILFTYYHFKNNDPTHGMSQIQKKRYNAHKICYFCKKKFRHVLNVEVISSHINRPVCDKCYRAVYEKMVTCGACNKEFRYYQTTKWLRDRMFVPDDDGIMRFVKLKSDSTTVRICNTCEQSNFEYVVLQFLRYLTPRQQEVMYAILLDNLTKDDIAVFVSTLKQETKLNE